MPRGEHNYEPCPISNKCKCNMETKPVRDADAARIGTSNEGPPPPPPGQAGDWELQYCNWWGWTWVKKSDQDPAKLQLPVRGSQKDCCPNNQRRGGLFSCFKKKKCCDGPIVLQAPQAAPTPQPEAPVADPEPVKNNPPQPEEKEEEDCCCCYDPCCCPCNQVCCPCMLQNQMCCCRCVDSSRSPCAKASKCCQTCCTEVKEQSTRTSEALIGAAPRSQPNKVCGCGRRKKCCRRPICCRRVRSPCCPCVQNVCCPCTDGPPKNRRTSERDNARVGEQILNYCLNRNVGRPNRDFLDFKSTNFSSLQKSLDILLKNNMNIMNLFEDKKDLRSGFAQVGAPNSHHTITCLSSDRIGRSSDTEHCKMLTAVCDAILSSHKFDATATCERNDSQNSFNTGFLNKILSDLNLPMLTRSAETHAQPKRSITRFLRNKSRVLLAPRFTNKVELLRKNNDLLKLGRKDSKSLRRIFVDSKSKERKRPECGKVNYFRSSDDDLNLSLDRLKLSSECTSTKPCVHAKPQAPLKLDHLEHLLNSIDLIKSEKRHSSDSLLQNGRKMHVLEATSPPFTDSDLLLSVDETKSDKKDGQ